MDFVINILSYFKNPLQKLIFNFKVKIKHRKKQNNKIVGEDLITSMIPSEMSISVLNPVTGARLPHSLLSICSGYNRI